MYIRVNNKVGMWGFGPLWLTFADDYPTEIINEELDADTRNAVKAALASGVLQEVSESGEPIPRVTSVVPKVQVAVVTAGTNQDEYVPPNIQSQLVKLLKNSVTTLRREIALIRNPQFLTFAITIEKADKNRKTVLSLLEAQLQKTGSVSKACNMYDALVKDEEVEEIKIQIADKVVITSVEEIKKVETPDK